MLNNLKRIILKYKLFGKNGFEMILKKVEIIEKELRIYQLDQFTQK